MQFNPIPTELTTAATDVALGVLAAGCVVSLWRLRGHDRWKATLWSWLFGILAVAAVLGAIAHGIEMSESLRSIIWQPLYMLLGLTVALFVVGAVYDWRGPQTASRMMPVMVCVAIGFFLVTRVAPGGFLVFVLYETVAMTCALAAYGMLTLRVGAPGMRLMLAGVGLNIIAAAIQASQAVSFTMIWPFDHNGVFHMIQMVALAVLWRGLHASLGAVPQKG